MIEKLTKEQEAKLPEYVTKWLSIGLSTDQLDVSAAREAVNLAYECADLKKPKHYIFCESPSQLVILVNLMTILPNTIEHFANNPNVTKKSLKAFKETLSKKDVIKYEKDFNSYIGNICYGSQDASWLSFYDFFLNETAVEGIDKIRGLIDTAKACGWWAPFEDLVIVSSKPVQISFKDKVLHNETGPAIQYADGMAVYALNGIVMTEEYVMTPANELSVSTVMKEQNVDIRRELLRKIGLERFVKDTGGHVVDELKINVNNKDCVYQLIDITLAEGITARVLKMDNPSINAMHVEGVEETCNTVKEALAWRNGFDVYSKPLALT